ncbi:MAG: hypothetical protein DRR06_09910 [Gammaproteobacteria bacterium]|nr:MAG: hypothetical protein DRR06_09910 [Gammaproteobacteria bacterium]
MGKRASTTFKSLVSGPNFMTSEPFSYGYIGTQWVYELAEGIGIMGERIYGVSVLHRETGAINHEMSSMVSSKEAAHQWVETWKQEPGGST